MDGLGKAWSRMEGVGSMVADMQRAGWSQEDGIVQINEISLPCWVSFHLFFCFWRQMLRSFIHNLPEDPPISKGHPHTHSFLGSPKADRKFYMHPSLFFPQVKISLSLSPTFLAHALCKGYFFFCCLRHIWDDGTAKSQDHRSPVLFIPFSELFSSFLRLPVSIVTFPPHPAFHT